MSRHLVVAAALILAPAASRADSPAAAPAPARAGEPDRFHGLSFDYSVYDESGLNAVNYKNAVTQYFEPGWEVGRAFFAGTRWERLTLAGRFALTRALKSYDPANYASFSDGGYAVRCSKLAVAQNGTVDPTQVRRCQYSSDYRWDYGDVRLTLSNPDLISLPLGIHFDPAVRAIVPVSLESRYATLVTSATALLGFSRAFLGDSLTASYTFGATKHFHRYTTAGESQGGALPDALVTSGYGAADVQSTTANFLADPSRLGTLGDLNPSFGFLHYFEIDYSRGRFNFSALYILIDTFSYAARCGPGQYGGVTTDPCANAGAVARGANGVGAAGRAIRDEQVLWLTAGFQLEDWIALSLSWINWAPLRFADNSYRQPFISTNYDAFTTVNLGFTISATKAAAHFIH